MKISLWHFNNVWWFLKNIYMHDNNHYDNNETQVSQTWFKKFKDKETETQDSYMACPHYKVSWYI